MQFWPANNYYVRLELTTGLQASMSVVRSLGNSVIRVDGPLDMEAIRLLLGTEREQVQHPYSIPTLPIFVPESHVHLIMRMLQNFQQFSLDLI